MLQKTPFSPFGKVLNALHSLFLTFLASLNISPVLPVQVIAPLISLGCFLQERPNSHFSRLKSYNIPYWCPLTYAMARKTGCITHPIRSHSTCYIILFKNLLHCPLISYLQPRHTNVVSQGDIISFCPFLSSISWHESKAHRRCQLSSRMLEQHIQGLIFNPQYKKGTLR